MKQLYVYIANALLIAACNLIDTAFANNISIDSICVLSSYTIITWIVEPIYYIGVYGYRVLLTNAKSCLAVTLCASAILSIVLWILSPHIPYIFFLTQSQYALFEKCLKALAISVPIIAMGEFFSECAILQCRNKLMLVTNIIFYVILISADAVVVKLGLDLVFIILSSTLAYAIYDIMMIVYLRDVLRERFNIKTAKQCMIHGSKIIVNDVFSMIAIIVYGVFASKLGTMQYAIHSVCYGATNEVESVTDATFDFQLVKISKEENLQKRYDKMNKLSRKYYFPVCAICLLFDLVELPFCCGDVSVWQCLPYLFLYGVWPLFIQVYEKNRAFLTSVQKTGKIMNGGFIGIAVRVPIVLISYYSGLGLVGFGLAASIDYFVRGLYYRSCSRKIVKGVL